jgi:hypothetical protein
MSNLPATTKKLTEKQAKFLDLLYGSCKGDIRLAYKEAGYTSNHPEYVLEALKDHIVNHADALLAASAVKASISILDVLDAPEALGAAVKLNAAKEVLDRAGVQKKTDQQATAPQIGIFILPEKRDLPKIIDITPSK